jgi:GNAT superfamily N-acetyltransferase
MGLVIEDDPARILPVLEAAVARDPVRHTILGTIAADVRDGRGGWCAMDGPAVAARSGSAYPVSLTDGWRDLAALAAVLAHLPALRAVGGPVDAVEALADELGRPVVERMDERLFRCDEVFAPEGVPGTARPATAADADLLIAWRGPYLVDVFGRIPPGTELARWPSLALAGTTWLWIVDGEPVAQASARPTVSGVARIGPVYTPPEHRGRGYGSAVTAAAAADVLARGAVPVLTTDLANPTSNRIYQAIGFRPVCDRASIWLV